MPKYYVWTIGCQMNRAESDRIAARLEHHGYELTDQVQDTDVIVLNSCVVRQGAEDRVVNKLMDLRALKKAHPEKVIALTGCLVESDIAALRKHFPHVDYFFRPGEAPPWLSNGENRVAVRPAVAVYVPIMQGCDNFCSYCIVPYRRGRERSRGLPEIVCEVERLVEGGAREVTLLGQNVDSYGHDLPDHPDLAGLLVALNGVAGLARIRFLTNHPKDMNRRLIDTIAALDRVCEQIMLPVQAGSNAILKAMRRGYTVEQYRDLIGYIRRRIKGVALSTDVIVGFPSETAAQFQETVNLLTELKFDTVHVAAYSPRAGTLAAREMPDDVSAGEKKARLAMIEALQEKIAADINSGLRGATEEVLVEGRTRGKWQGRTRTGKLVFFASDQDYRGRLAPVKIEKTSAWSLQGHIDDNQEVSDTCVN